MRRRGSEFSRTTVSIPLDVKAQMDPLKDQVNWSAVATRAFQAKLLEIQARKAKSMSTEEIVQRMKGVQAQELEEEYDEGKDAGRRWAASKASPKELRRLAHYIQNPDSGSVDWWDVGFTGWLAPHGATDYFAFAVWPGRDQDQAVADEFWEHALGNDADRVQNADYFRGFGEGAAEVWSEVADKL